MNTTRSRQHNVGSETINKTALSADDDKRIILEDKITTLAIGYKGTRYAGMTLGKEVTKRIEEESNQVNDCREGSKANANKNKIRS